ncbi:MAG: type II toxin-antitoxin system HicA family toxin [Xenococcaceae cyanobacterium]
MPKLPRVSGKDAVKVFKKLGWEVSRQRGSHIIMTKEGSIYTLSVPNKSILAPGLLRSLISKADLTVDEFIDLL